MTSSSLLSNKTAAHVDGGDDNDARWPPEIQSKLLAEFFFDVDKIVGFHTTRAKWAAFFISLIPAYSIILAPIFCANACTIRKNLNEKAGSMRVGLTPEELIFTTGSFGGLCRCNCQKTGARSVVIPLNRITDLVIEMPAGGCLPPNVLSKTRIQTAGQGAIAGSSEVDLEGLVDADHFRRTILALRHGEPLPEPRDPKAARLYRQPPPTSKAAAAPVTSDADATSPVRALDHERAAPSSDAQIETVELLKEVNKSLLTMCQLMQQQQQQQSKSQRTKSLIDE